MYLSEDQMWSHEQLFAARDAVKLLGNEWLGKFLLGLSAANGSAFLTMATQLASRPYPRWFVSVCAAACVVFLVGLVTAGAAINSTWMMYDLRGSELDAKLAVKDFDKMVRAEKDAPDLKLFREQMVKNTDLWRKPQFDNYGNANLAAQISALSFGVGIIMTLIAIIINALSPVRPPGPKSDMIT